MRCPYCEAPLDGERAARDEHGLVCTVCPLRPVRPLELSDGLRGLLGAVRGAIAPPTRLGIAQRALADVERREGAVIPDAVLALFVACGWSLGRLVEERFLRTAVEATHGAEVANDPRGRVLVFDRWDEHPMFSAGFRPQRDRSEPSLIVWDYKKWCPLRGSPIRSVSTYVEHRLAGSLADVPITLGPPDPTFAPCIEDWPPPPRDRFVEHEKFGRGRVLSAQGDQLEIDFGPAGIKRLLSRFVRPS